MYTCFTDGACNNGGTTLYGTVTTTGNTIATCGQSWTGVGLAFGHCQYVYLSGCYYENIDSLYTTYGQATSGTCTCH